MTGQLPIVAEQLSRSYGARRGIVDISFEARPGEIFGFLGPNGAGKTTTIRVLMGVLRPGAGNARVFGLDCWSDAPAVKALVGFLPGDIHLWEHLTGDEFLDFLAAFRQHRDERRRRMLTDRFELDVTTKIRHLSKGNRQKLAIVQAFMHDAPLLILDEPSAGLDPLMQVTLLELMREERAAGKTVFLSSHNLPEVERIADRVAIVREGTMVAVEEVSRLKALRERRMEVILRDPRPAEVFAGIPGVRVLRVQGDGRHIDLAVRGAPGELLRALANLPVEDLTYGPPDLESVFLHYYGQDEAGDDTLASTAEAEIDMAEVA